MFGAELFHQFRDAAELALLAILVERFVQAVGEFLGFDLEQNAIEQ